MKKLLLMLIIMSAFAAAEIIVINDTEKDFYTLENMHLSGDLQANELDISGSGQLISGSDVRIYLLGPAEDIVIKDIYLNNVLVPVSFDNKGYFIVMSGEGTFSFSGKMLIRKLGQLQLRIPGPVNELTFDLEHGYAVNGDRYGVYDKSVTIQRSEKAAMLVDGSFKYTYAQRNAFYYVIDFKSFGSTLGQYTIDLPNGEAISTVTGSLSWRQTGNKLILELEGSTATVSVSGLFSSTNLRVPLFEGTHKVTIESDAEKKITISTTAKEVDISEAGIPATYPNARAFLANVNDRFSITIKNLEILPSLAASVKSASNKVAITKKGSIVGELQYQYANTGVDYIEIDAPGQPLYASHQQGAVKLTKDDKFLLAFPKSNHGSLDMVYFTTVPKLGLFDVLEVPLAKTDLPITQQTTTIYLPKDYTVVDTLGVAGGSELPSFKSIILFILILGGLAMWLKKDWKFITFYVIFASGLLLFDNRLLLLMIGATIFLIVKRYLVGKTWWRWALAGAGILVAVVVILIAAGSLLRGGIMSASDSMSVAGNYAEIDSDKSAPQLRGMEMVGEDEGAISIPTRTGVLPVKLELPRMGKQITVTNYLVTKENPVELKLVLISKWLIYLYMLFTAIAGLYGFKRYILSTT